MTERQNILLLVIDQLRADCVDGALAGHVRMPNLRALMADAVTFTNHYSVASPCGPSRASLLTGQYAMNHRSVRNGTPLAAHRPTLPREMRRLGYLPLLYGYTDTTQDPTTLDPGDPALKTYEWGMSGFQEVVEMRMEQSCAWHGYLKRQGYDLPPYPDIYRPKGSRIDDPAPYRAEDSDTAFLTDRFVEDILSRPKGWFAHLCYLRPHPPLVAPEPYNRMYDPAEMPLPVGAMGDHRFASAARAYKTVADMVEGFPDLQPGPETTATLRALYFALATEVDHHIGRVIDALKQAGLYDETLIVVTADHGEMLGDFGIWGKSTYHDGAFHVPLIIRHADMAKGLRIDRPTESVDISPTLIALCGGQVPDAMDGRSLIPFLQRRESGDWRRETVSELDFGNPVDPTLFEDMLSLPCAAANLAVLRTESHALVHFAGDLPQILFDRTAARGGSDITNDSASGQILLDLSRRMLSHRMMHGEGTFARTMVTAQGVRRAGAE